MAQRYIYTPRRNIYNRMWDAKLSAPLTLKRVSGRLAYTIFLTRTVVVLAGGLCGGANVLKRRLVAVGLSDTGNFASVVGNNSLDVDLTGTLAAL